VKLKEMSQESQFSRVKISKLITSSHPFYSYANLNRAPFSPTPRGAAGLPSPSLPQLTSGEIGQLIAALPSAYLDDWKAAALKAKSEQGVAWMAAAHENVNIVRELNCQSWPLQHSG